MELGVEEFYKNIADNVKVIRQRRGLKQKVLASLTGISPTSISNIERGKKKVTVEDLYLLSKGLNVTVSELIYKKL